MGLFDRRKFLQRALFTGSLLGFIPWHLGQANSKKSFKPDFSVPLAENFWSELRKQFYLTNSRTYFNTAGLGAAPKVVVDTLQQKTIDMATIADTHHRYIEKNREKVAEFLGTEASSIAFTRNTTESINLAAQSIPLEPGDEVLLSTHEHIGGAAPWLALKEKKGITVKLFDLDLTGNNNLELFQQHITNKTKVVCLSHITCSTGLVLPIKAIIDYCRQHSIISCIDGAQAVGMVPVDLSALQPDFYAFSGHKWLLGPIETGGLFIHKSTLDKIAPPFTGAYSIDSYDLPAQLLEYNKRAEMMEYGTRNAAQIAALGSAIDFLTAIGIEKIESRGRGLAEQLKTGLNKNSKVELLTPANPHYSASIVTFKIKDIPYLKVQETLGKEHKMRVRGVYEGQIDAIRISCAIYNSPDEINTLVDAIGKISND